MNTPPKSQIAGLKETKYALQPTPGEPRNSSDNATKRRQRSNILAKKWHFVCSSPEVAAPPSIGSSAREYTRNDDDENNEGGGSELASIDKYYNGTITRSPIRVPGEIEKLIALPALSASASEESLRVFASQASAALRCVEFTLRHTKTQNAALRIENDKLIGKNLVLQERLETKEAHQYESTGRQAIVVTVQ